MLFSWEYFLNKGMVSEKKTSLHVLHSGASRQLRFIYFLTICEVLSHMFFQLFLAVDTEEEVGKMSLLILQMNCCWRKVKWLEVAKRGFIQARGLQLTEVRELEQPQVATRNT